MYRMSHPWQELYLLAARYGHVFSGEARWGWLQTRGPPLRRDARQFGSSLFYFRGWLRLMGRRRVKWKILGLACFGCLTSGVFRDVA